MSLGVRLSFVLILFSAVLAGGCINSYTSSPHPGDYDLDVELPEYDEDEPDPDLPESESAVNDGDLTDSEDGEHLEGADIEGEFDGEPGESAENADSDIEGESIDVEESE